MGLRWGVPGDERPIWRFRKGWCFSFVGALVMLDFPGGSDGKASAYNVVDPGSIPRWGRSSGEGNDTHTSTLAWKIPREDPGRLQSMGLQRVGHN